MPAYLLQRLVGRPARTEPIGAILEICFEDRLQDQQGRHLDHPVAHRRYAQRPQLPIRFRYVDAPYRCRRVGLGAKRLLDFVQKSLHTGFRRFDFFDLYAVHPGRAPIGSHPFPSRFQHIAPIDPIVQSVKPELRLLLGLLAQLLSQQREFVWGSVSTRLFLQGFDKLPFFRNRIFVQAVLLPSTAAMFPVRPLGSTGVTTLPRYYGPLRLPARTVPSVIDSLWSFGVGCPSPPCRVSQVPRLIYSCALVPNHPGRSGECLLIASPPISGFIPSGGLATFTGVTRPNRVRLRYGSQVCFPGFHQPDYSDSLRIGYMHERAIYMVNSFQFTRSARLGLVYQTSRMNGPIRSGQI